VLLVQVQVLVECEEVRQLLLLRLRLRLYLVAGVVAVVEFRLQRVVGFVVERLQRSEEVDGGLYQL
jgi:hypothetical protein